MARRVTFTSNFSGTTIDFSGPMFDGRALRAVKQFCDHVELEVGEYGVQVIREELDNVLQHPTGYYKSQIHSVKRGAHVIIDDNRVVYGPWLEGTGSRNSPVTRFPGYFTFRRMYRKIQLNAGRIAEQLFRAQYLHRIR